jgi:hypothetical protein
MCTVERLSHIKDLLRSSKRIVFPLVTPSGNLAGLILRRNVMFCISHSPTFRSFEDAQSQQARNHSEEIRHAEAHMQDWRRDKYDEAHTIMKGSAALEDAFLNFTPYMDAGCMTARPATPAKRLAALFRRVGLSHLCITDKNNVFQGLITRRALITPPAHLMPPAPAAVSHAAPEHDAHVVAHSEEEDPSLRKRHAASIDEGDEEHKHA